MKKRIIILAALATFSATSLFASGQHSSSLQTGPKLYSAESKTSLVGNFEHSDRQYSANSASPKLKSTGSSSQNVAPLDLAAIERQESRARQLRG